MNNPFYTNLLRLWLCAVNSWFFASEGQGSQNLSFFEELR
jgi:hypothetical protein